MESRASPSPPVLAAAVALAASAGILARSIVVRPLGDIGRYFEIARAFAAGALLKLFPLVLGPMLLALAARDRSARRFLGGGLLGALPAALLALVWPWWHFADFHAGRGLQVESLPASIAWLGHHLLGWAATWATAPASCEVHGPWADGVLGATRLTWVVVALVSAAFAALAACTVTPLIYPSPSYRTGLDLPTTVLLLARKASWVGAAAWLVAAPARRAWLRGTSNR